MATLDEKLKARYGADRFNPSQGQSSMSYKEWLDRHPALRVGMARGKFTEEDAQAKYNAATSAEGGQEWLDSNPDWQTYSPGAPEGFAKGHRALNDAGEEVYPNLGQRDGQFNDAWVRPGTHPGPGPLRGGRPGPPRGGRP